MSLLRYALLSICLISLGSPSALAADALFALDGAAGSATVFDAETLEQLAVAPAPLGAFAAHAAAGPDDTGAAAKYYIVGVREVAVLDASFTPTGSVTLPDAALGTAQATALSADGRRLLVAGLNSVWLIDTASDSLAAALDPGFRPGGVLLAADPALAYVPADGKPWARTIDLAADALLPGAAPLPAAFDVWDASPSGYQTFSYTGAGLWDASALELTPVVADWRAAEAKGLAAKIAASSAARIEATDGGYFYLAEGSRLQGGHALGTVEDVINPLTGEPFDPSQAAWTTAGERVYLVSGGRLVAFEPARPEEAVSTVLASQPTALSTAAVQGIATGRLELITEGDFKAAGGTRVEIQVRVLNASNGPVRDVPVMASRIFPTAAPLECAPGISDADGVAKVYCAIGTVSQEGNVQVTLTDADGRTGPALSFILAPPLQFDGLRILEAPAGSYPSDEPFDIVVQAAQDLLPAVGAGLNVVTEPNDRDIIRCTGTFRTNELGQATITCEGQSEIAAPTSVVVRIRDLRRNEVFIELTLDPELVAPSGLEVVSGDNQEVLQLNRLPEPLVMRNTLNGAPRKKGTLMQVIVLGAPMTCPLQVPVGDDGITSFSCTAGSLSQGQETAESIVRVTDQHVQNVPPVGDQVVIRELRFTVTTVRFFSGGGAEDLELLSSDELTGRVDEPIINAMRVRATFSGIPAGGVTVHFFSDDDVTFDPPMAITRSDGIATTNITLGCNPGNDARVFVGFTPGTSYFRVDIEGEPGDFAKMTPTQGDGQSGFPGQQLRQALLAVASDRCGNPIGGIQTRWRVIPERAATLANVVSDSRGNTGLVSALPTLGSYGGPLQVEVGTGNSFVRFQINVDLPPDQLRVRSGDRQSGAPGHPLPQPLVAEVMGSTGFGVGGVPVTFAVVQGSGSLSQTQAQTNTYGVAFTRLTVGTASGVTGPAQSVGPPVTVEARALGQTVRFQVNGSSGPRAPVEGFVNGASFVPGWTPGALGSIFGQGLADGAEPVVATSTPLPTTLGGVQVLINGTAAPLFFVSGGQVNLQTPFETSTGAATITIINNGKQTVVEGVPVNAVQPGIFEINVEGKRIAAALRQDFSVITPSNPAVPGEVVQLYYTGGGPLDPVAATNQPGPSSPLSFTTQPVVVGVDGAGQNVLASVYAPGLITANQVNFTLGEDTASGDRTLNMSVGGQFSQQSVLPVQ